MAGYGPQKHELNQYAKAEITTFDTYYERTPNPADHLRWRRYVKNEFSSIIIAIGIFLFATLRADPSPRLLIAVSDERSAVFMQPFCECYIALRCHRRRRPDLPAGHCKHTARAECEKQLGKLGPDGRRSVMRSQIGRFEALVHVAPIMQCAAAKRLMRAPAK
jgi:hypothetical protein